MVWELKSDSNIYLNNGRLSDEEKYTICSHCFYTLV